MIINLNNNDIYLLLYNFDSNMDKDPAHMQILLLKLLSLLLLQ